MLLNCNVCGASLIDAEKIGLCNRCGDFICETCLGEGALVCSKCVVGISTERESELERARR